MFSALVVTLREGVEAALIVGITLVYLSKIGRPDLRRTVYYALVAALFGSIAGAVALSYAPINQDKVEGWVMLVAAIFVVSMPASSRARLRTRSVPLPAQAPNGGCLLSCSLWSSGKALRRWLFLPVFP